MCQKLFSNYYQFRYSDGDSDGNGGDSNGNGNGNGNGDGDGRSIISSRGSSSSSDIYKLMNTQIIKRLCISIFYICDEIIDEINTFQELESITIVNYFGAWFGNSFWRLHFLNRLRDDIVVNFDLYIGYSETTNNDIKPKGIKDDQPLTFKCNNLSVVFQYEVDDYYNFIYRDIISKLKFKSLYFNSIGPSHLLQYHSISKLNKTIESVRINNDHIPLYSLYRFLKAPNLHTLKFCLNFPSLSKLYTDSNKHQYQYHFDLESLDNTVNEDQQYLCPLFRSLPPYSMQLWNECIKLIGSNTTITTFEFFEADCHECDIGHNDFELDTGFLNDFIDSFSNNKTIKTLSINFGNSFSSEFLTSKIATMLDQNSTLKNLNLYFDYNFVNKISKKTTNKKCSINK
ncbi:hypothetical protein ACTFIZ_008824 [Dictyostelium cf. discoideum]